MTPLKKGPLLVSSERMESRLADAYRALRVSVSSANGERPPVTVLVASASRGEGRTTTVANLGIVAGRIGGPVVLVDADLRKPSLHLLLDAGTGSNGRSPGMRSGSPPPGLAEVARHGAAAADLVLKTPFPGVWLLPAGVDRDRPSELVASPRLAETLQSFRDRAELVLIDSPPCLEHVDAVEIAAHVDGVLYVVRAGDHDRSAQRHVRSQLLHTRARMLGVVFNGA